MGNGIHVPTVTPEIKYTFQYAMLCDGYAMRWYALAYDVNALLLTIQISRLLMSNSSLYGRHVGAQRNDRDTHARRKMY